MIVAYKNYKRTERLSLSLLSAMHFAPRAEFHCLFLYDESKDELSKDAKTIRDMGVQVHFAKSKHNVGPASNSESNGLYFTEYLNYFSKIFQNKKKVIVLDEDNYFTTGSTLKWMEETEFDLAWARWYCPRGWGVNASIVGVNFEKIGHVFPLPERVEYIETLLQKELYEKAISAGAVTKEIPTRNNHNYFGDGSWTNDVNEIRRHMLEAKIIGG